MLNTIILFLTGIVCFVIFFDQSIFLKKYKTKINDDSTVYIIDHGILLPVICFA